MAVPAATLNVPPGLRAGFGAVFGGFAFLLRTPRALPYALVPAAILTALALTLSGLALFQVHPLWRIAEHEPDLMLRFRVALAPKKARAG
jgi:hypothetical protein